ncbi:hypothetical protein A2U01_0090024, partial [Trifolium medium]|nr:hypothetical protein [Trifolium medium]
MLCSWRCVQGWMAQGAVREQVRLSLWSWRKAPVFLRKA